MDYKFLKIISSQELLMRAKDVVKREAKLTLEFLYHLRKIERRRLHVEMGYSSLFSFVEKEYKYSSGSTYRRVEAMRLLKEIPEIETDILSGDLNLTSLCEVSKFFKTESIKPVERKKIIETIKCKSTREVKRKLADLGTQPERSIERERILSKTCTELTFSISNDLMEKLNLLRAFMSHKHPRLTYEILLQELADIALQRYGKGHRVSTSPPKLSQVARKTNENETLGKPEIENYCRRRSRYIPAGIKRSVWTRDQGKCTFVSRLSKQKCGSTHFIEFDHILPFSHGGDSTPGNLTLRCRAHNQLAAIKMFGESKLEEFTNLIGNHVEFT